MNTCARQSLGDGIGATPFGGGSEFSELSDDLKKRAWLRRQVVKTSTYALMHFCVAIGVAYALTWDWRVALSVGLIEPIVQTVAYALHERGWAVLAPSSAAD